MAQAQIEKIPTTLWILLSDTNLYNQIEAASFIWLTRQNNVVNKSLLSCQNQLIFDFFVSKHEECPYNNPCFQCVKTT